MTHNAEDTKYGRCEVTAKSSGKRCGRAAVGEHGKCDMHGGKSKKGEDSPTFKHGLFSDHLSEEDREVIDLLEEYDDAEKLDEIINWRLARLRRAVKALNGEQDRNFWDAFNEIVTEADEIGPEEIGELSNMLDRGNRAVQDEIDVVRKLIKDRNKIAEGENINMGWKEMLAGDGS